MEQTLFPCPHCNAKYPFKKILIGRNVRCTKCRNAFALQKTGIAVKVEPHGPTQPEPNQQNEEAIASIRSESSLSLNEVRQKAQERIKKQELLKKKLSDTLSDAAMSALEAEVEKELKDELKNKTKTHIKKNNGTEIIRTNQSQLDHKRTKKMFYLGVSALALTLLSLLYVLLKSPTPEELAISNYAQEPPFALKDKPESVDHYRSLMWYSQIPNQIPQTVVVDLDSFSLAGNPETYSCDLSEELNQFKPLARMYKRISWKANAKEFDQFYNINPETRTQLELQTQHSLQRGLETQNPELKAPIIHKRPIPDLWISVGKEETARALWWNNQLKIQDEKTLKDKLLKQGIVVILSSELKMRIAKRTDNNDLANFVSKIFLGTTDSKGSFDWQQKMLNGTIPKTFTIQKFTGTRGTQLRKRGANLFRRAGLSYSGILIKCDELDSQWRIFEFMVD